jgi:hypothetical protein
VVNETGRDCTKCAVFKPWADYHKAKKGLCGKAQQCKQCVHKYFHQRWKADPDYRARVKAHRRKPEMQAWLAEYNQRPEVIAHTKAYFKVLNSTEQHKRYSKNISLKSHYGITLEQYEGALAEQGGGCAICGVTTNTNRRSLHVDHDHSSGQIRGILCHHCNLGIGNLKDDPTLLTKAAAYLVRWANIHSNASSPEITNPAQAPAKS